MSTGKKNIVIFISGGGSNARVICNYFQQHPSIQVKAIFSNKNNEAMQQFAQSKQIDFVQFNKAQWKDDLFLELLKPYEADLLVLAGFLWLVPHFLIHAFEHKIVNIHPSLLPKYGGKGMYGHFVHEAVVKAGEKESGLSIHLVNEAYDEGQILHQQAVQLAANESPDTLAAKVLEQEHYWYARIIEKHLTKQ